MSELTKSELKIAPENLLINRFRGYYPVVIDVETAGFNAKTDAMLEIAATLVDMDEEGILHPAKTHHFHITPFEGANLEQSALDFNGIDPFNPLREAVTEATALTAIFKAIRAKLKETGCHRAIIVAHNATFDQSFVNAAASRTRIKRNPFHPFSSFDTSALSGLALGHTVLATACKRAKIEFNNKEAHSALYDTEKTAELFCFIVNKWKSLGGWPLIATDNEDENNR